VECQGIEVHAVRDEVAHTRSDTHRRLKCAGRRRSEALAIGTRLVLRWLRRHFPHHFVQVEGLGFTHGKNTEI